MRQSRAPTTYGKPGLGVSRGWQEPPGLGDWPRSSPLPNRRKANKSSVLNTKRKEMFTANMLKQRSQNLKVVSLLSAPNTPSAQSHPVQVRDGHGIFLRWEILAVLPEDGGGGGGKAEKESGASSFPSLSSLRATRILVPWSEASPAVLGTESSQRFPATLPLGYGPFSPFPLHSWAKEALKNG